MNKDIIIYSQYPGLGDHLQYSTLPEEFSKLGYNVYISDKSACRNEDIYDLVWGKNPYVKGKSNKYPNAGQWKWYPEGKDIPQTKELGFMGCMERRNGLKNKNKYPKIYYKYNKLELLKDTVIIDINACSNKNFMKNNINKIINLINNLIKENGYKNIKVLNYTKFEHLNNIDAFQKYDKYDINSIYELCDVLNSCKAVICGYSGNYALASAIKQEKQYPKIHCVKPYPHYESWHNHGYDNAIFHDI